jgi:hypothetical protein
MKRVAPFPVYKRRLIGYIRLLNKFTAHRAVAARPSPGRRVIRTELLLA